jgi:arylsulfatase A-like enzyme
MNAVRPSGEPRDGDNPYFSMQEFMRFLDDEDTRPATGQYIFLHVILPHGPSVLDDECNYIGELTKAQGTAQAEQERYLEQVQCSHKLLGLLVKKLESLGRLDNSLIIAQADHGYYMYPADLGVLYKFKPLDVAVPRIDHDKADSSTWPSEMIEVKSSALLLIKFPGQSSASRSDKPVQMIDIAPTILRYFDIETPASMRGIPIQDMPASPARDRFFFASNRIPERTRPNVISEYRYADGEWKFAEDIAIPTSADQLFIMGATP